MLLSTAGLNRIVEHAVGDLTVTVEAGVTLEQLQNFLRPFNQFLPLDSAFAQATLGGIVATADTGTWRQGYGGVRDMVLGLSLVRSDGQIAKAGGKVVKNVAGYDLMKLFTGSYGTLGIITEITWRLYPIPEASQTLGITGEATAIQTLAQALRSSGLTPTAAEIISPQLVKSLNLGDNFGLLLRFQSIPASIAKQGEQVKELVTSLGCEMSFYADNAEVSLWQQLAKAINFPSQNTSLTCKIGIIPSQILSVLEELEKVSSGIGAINLSSGIGKLQLPNLDTALKLRSFAEAHQGYLTLLDARLHSKENLEAWGYSGNARTLMQSLKNKFDPQNILSLSRSL
jgi:glycolate oxidase FAD binding subunit